MCFGSLGAANAISHQPAKGRWVLRRWSVKLLAMLRLQVAIARLVVASGRDRGMEAHTSELSL